MRNLGKLFWKGEAALTIIGICIGFILGIAVTLCFLKKGSIGNLVVAEDADEASYLFLEITKADIEKLRAHTIIKLNVIDRHMAARK